MPNENLEVMKYKIMSATRQKLLKETQVYKLRNTERSFSEKLSLIKTETTFINEQLQEIKDSLTQINHQISMIDICKASEITKIQRQKDNLQGHRNGFQSFFDRERHLTEVNNREIEEKESLEQEIRRQKEQQVAEKNEQQAREAATIEKECDALERECVVLKKRNTAIMLKLRRKLVETENIRRDLMKKKGIEVSKNPEE